MFSCYLFTIQVYVAFCWLVKTSNYIEQCRFSCAVWTNDTDYFALVNSNVNPLQRSKSSEYLLNIDNLQQFFHKLYFSCFKSEVNR